MKRLIILVILTLFSLGNKARGSDIALSNTCLNFGSVYENLSITDSVYVLNNGTDTLFLTGLSTTTSEFSVNAASFFVLPGDSALVEVTFSPLTAGSFLDTLEILNSNADTVVCLSGIGVASAILNFQPSQITEIMLGCNDSVTAPITLYNNGSSTLFFELNNYSNNGIYYDSISFSYYIGAGATTNHIFISDFSSIDSVFLEITINGDYDASNEYADLYVEGTYISTIDDMDVPNGTDVVIDYAFGGADLIGWLSDGQLGISINNSQYVHEFGQQFHQVRLKIKNKAKWITAITPETGTIQSGDSINLLFDLTASGLESGQYQFNLNVNSNDPSASNSVIPIQMNVFGTPDILLSNSCISFDTIMENSTIIDSIWVYNTGCDTLFLTNTTSTVNFNPVALNQYVLPFDSTVLKVVFSPNTIGTVIDTLYIINNDIDTFLCLSGQAIGAPVMAYQPNQINDTIYGCNDSLTVPISFFNVGNGKLEQSQYLVESENTAIQFFDGFETGVLDNWTGSGISVITTNNPASGNYCLSHSGTSGGLVYTFPNDTVHYFSIKLRSEATQGYSNYCRVGNSNHSFGLCSINKIEDSSYQVIASNVVNYPILNVWTHFEFKGINYQTKTFDLYIDGQLIDTDVGFYYSSLTDLSRIYLSSGDFSFSYYDDVILKTFGSPDWMSIETDTLTVNINDTSDLNLTFHSDGLTSGNYYSNLIINSNDPLSLVDTIPIELVVNGDPKIGFSDTCLNFGSIQENSILSDSVTIYNSGCDTLFVTSISTSSSEFVPSNTSLTVLPFDSLKLGVDFLPTVVGTYNDTLYFSNNDKDTAICLSGIAFGAPLVSIYPDSLYAVLDCIDSTQIDFTIYNTGNAELFWSYDTVTSNSIAFNDSSIISFGSGGALTSHVFSDQFGYADFLTIEVIMKGDYNSTGEYATLSVEGSTPVILIDNNVSNGSVIVNQYSYSGQVVQNWLLDDQLIINIQNTTLVGNYSGPSYHQVNVSIGGTSWVRDISPQIDTISIGDSSVLTIDLNSAGLMSGNHLVDLPFSFNDPQSPGINVPVYLSVIGDLNVGLSDTCIDFTGIQENTSIGKSLMVYNFGCDTLVVTHIHSDINEFVPVDSSLSIPPWDSASLFIEFMPVAMGSYSGIIQLLTNDVDTSICVSGVAVGAPELSYDPVSINETIYSCDDSLVVPVTFYNIGNDSLVFNQNLIEIDVSTGFFDGFEDSTYSNWVSVSGNAPSVVSDNPASGNYCIELNNSVLVYNFAPDSIEYFSIKVRFDSIGFGNGFSLGNQSLHGGLLSVSHQGSNQYLLQTDTYRYYTKVNNWTHFELKNIDFINQHYDLYIDGNLIDHNVGFRYAITDLSRLQINNYGHFDDIEFRNEAKPEWANLELDSGLVAVGDSLMIDLILYSEDVKSGVYHSNLIINTNDPTNLLDTIPISFTVDGEPKIEFVDSCLNFGNTLENTSIIDSIMLYNTGCDTLFISNSTTGLPEFNVVTPLAYIPPCDSAQLAVSFSPTAIGIYNTQLQVFNNDIDTLVCLTGIADGAAVIGYSPPSIDTAIYSCDDSLSIPVTIYNLGNDTLILIQQAIDIYPDSSVFFEGFEYGNYDHWDVFGSGSTQTIETTNPASGQNCLSIIGGYGSLHGIKRIFNPAPIEYFSIKLKYDGTTGNGNYCFVGDSSNAFSLVRIYHQYNGVYRIAGLSNYYHANTGDWAHFEFKNIDYQSHVFDLYVDDTLRVSAMPFNTGTFAISEVSLFNSNSPYKGYYDDIQIGKPNVSGWIELTEDSLSVPNGDSLVYNLQLKSKDLPVGQYYSNIFIQSNDPLSLEDTIQVSLLVDGMADISLSDTCIDFGNIYENTVISDSLTLYNTGCDTLFISSITTSNAHYNASFPSYILPYDSSIIKIDFAPTTFGSLDAILHIHNNAVDTNICLQAYADGAPVISYSLDSLNVLINTCEDSIIVPFGIINSGNGGLNTSIVNLNYEIYGFEDGFEDGTHDQWVENNQTGVTNVLGPNPSFPSYVSGSYCLQVGASGLTKDFPGSQVDYFSVKLRSYQSSGNDNYCYVGDTSIYLAYMYHNGPNQYIVEGNSLVVYTVINPWTQIELKNINYSAKTFDVYFDGVLTATGVGFYDSSVNQMSRVELRTNSSFLAGFYDDIKIGSGFTIPKWQFIIPDTATVNINDTVFIPLVYSSVGLEPGVYKSEFIINSNDVLNPVDTIPVSLTFVGHPEITLSDTCVSFSDVPENTTQTDSIFIYNSGCDTLDILSLFVSGSNFGFSLEDSLLAPEDSATVTISFSPTGVGVYNDSLQITNNDVDTLICLTGEAIYSPSISFSTNNIDVLACSDSVVVRGIIYNNGLGVLNWQFNSALVSISGHPVLSVSNGSGIVNPGDSVQVEFTIDMTGTSVGQFIDFIDVNSNDPQNPVSSMVINLNIIERPCADFNYVNVNNCGGKIEFTDISLNNPTTWFWDFGDGHTSTVQHPSHTYFQNGTYTVQLIATNGLGNTTLSQQINVMPFTPGTTTIDIFSPLVEGTPILFGSNTQNGQGWQWIFGDGDSAFVQLPTHSYSTYGQYSVTLHAINEGGCVLYGDTLVSVGGLGYTEIGTGIKLYPNPSVGKFRVEGLEGELVKSITIKDVTGKVILRLKGHNNEIELDASKGVYYVEVVLSDSTSIIKKLVLQ